MRFLANLIYSQKEETKHLNKIFFYLYSYPNNQNIICLLFTYKRKACYSHIIVATQEFNYNVDATIEVPKLGIASQIRKIQLRCEMKILNSI